MVAWRIHWIRGGEEAGTNLQSQEWQGHLAEHKSEDRERLRETKGGVRTREELGPGCRVCGAQAVGTGIRVR